ncbi:MAG TPA: zinc ribbon domain-containing protein [Trebonia sp.]|nr:zinc ribbon domain-containing protein [Trebonia sp.]
MTEAERDKLLREGATIQGMVKSNEPSAADRTIAVVHLSVRFKDNQTVEFSQELASLYQPEPGSQEARRLAEVRGAEQLRHPDRIPKIQLPLFGGEMAPVRYDEANRNRIVIDVPELHKRALRDYIKREQKQQGQSPATKGTQTGPPWAVPAHCPNCGAPVDQATASRDRDPMCPFCHQPIPVAPLS